MDGASHVYMRDRLENALAAMGCPDARPTAVLVMEVLPEIMGELVEIGRRSILDEATALVDGPRQEAYGDPVECLARWAEILRVLYGWDIDAHKAAVAMTQLKIVRESFTPGRDNRVDAAGYLDIADRAVC